MLNKRLRLTTSCQLIELGEAVFIRQAEGSYNHAGPRSEWIKLLRPFIEENATVEEILCRTPKSKHPYLESTIQALIEMGILVLEEKIQSSPDSTCHIALATGKQIDVLCSKTIAIVGSGAWLAETVFEILSCHFHKLHLVWLEDWAIGEHDIALLGGRFAEQVGQNGIEVLNTYLLSTFPNLELQQTLPEHGIRELTTIVEKSNGLLLLRGHEQDALSVYINQLCHQASLPWLSISTWGFHVEAGPLVVPGDTPCYECYLERVATNRYHAEGTSLFVQYARQYAFYQIIQNKRLTRQGVSFAAQIASIEMCKYMISNLTWQLPKTVGGILQADVLEWAFVQSSVLKVPRCHVCGKPYHKNPAINFWMDPQNK